MKRRIGFLFTILLLCAVSALLIIRENRTVSVTSYTVKSSRLPAALEGYRIAQVSDLHNETFGDGNDILLQLLQEAEPDIIVITGDLIDSVETDLSVGIAFAEAAVSIAPTYFVTGNHEAAIRKHRQLARDLKAVGVTVLRDEKITVTAGNESLTILGLKDPNFFPGNPAEAAGQSLTKLMTDEEDTYTILLAHRPELFDVYVAGGVDLILSGHAHGGQFRLPWIGGLYAPAQGLFPAYDGGCYTEGNTTMVVSRGIGNSRFPFRVNNPPEIVLVELRLS